MSVLYMMVGLPGSGKSTEAERIGKSLGIPVVSSDGIRREFTGSEKDFSMDAQIWTSVIPERLRSTLQEGDAVFDATNLRVRDRSKVRRCIGPKHSCCAVFMDTPLEICIERQANRKRKVPRERIEEMHREMVLPDTSEGFVAVYIVGNTEKYMGKSPERDLD